MALKHRLTDVLKTIISPIRERRAELSQETGTIMDILRTGVEHGRAVTEQTKEEIMESLGLFRL